MPEASKIFVSYDTSVTIEKLRQIVAANNCAIVKENVERRTIVVTVPVGEEADYVATFNSIVGLGAFLDPQFISFRS
jgi:hypothetical protein